MLVGANTLNIAADLAAMAEALRLLFGGSAHVYAITFGLLTVLLQVFLPYRSYVRWLKWLTLALLAYVVLVFTLDLNLAEVLRGAFALELPPGANAHDAILMRVAPRSVISARAVSAMICCTVTASLATGQVQLMSPTVRKRT